MRQRLDEDDIVRNPPLRHLVGIEREHLLTRQPGTGTALDDEQRPLVPARVLDPDHRRFGDRGVADGDVLERDRADPFAAALDHILRAIGDLQVTVGIDGRDIAGGKPAVAQRRSAFGPVIAGRDPPAAHQKIAEARAVPRQLVARAVDDLKIDAGDDAALLAFEGKQRRGIRGAMLAFELRKGADRAHLGHAPGMKDLDAVILLEALDHCRRASRAADHQTFQRRQP